MAEQSKLDVIKEYGGTAYGPEYGAWADLQYEDENGNDMTRTTMMLVNPVWTEPLEKADGEYFTNWAYDPELDMYFLLIKWQNGVRLPIAFKKDEGGKMLFDNYVKIPFDVMVSNKKMSGNIEQDDTLRMRVLWDVKFSKAKNANWPED
ncbi:hypothetical protein Desca_0901 [Desulfotomaculum nigrificans CO-1-SRB]|uniref:Uncharacterized protein n=1 Tax=Desulfotomaculum nigrificans (strain DSM 14880 / VKM B-2319 / CO-1-SRB) TaxID=868595 RepID=F6B9T2_DESCC|nr:hypothetical protein [Desulfotomaculum nigrificans]AEF93780.1 hypothetical protein Desca_0901 [Desulfotomaculum nigrificans CO-1-SRB]